MVSNRDNKHGSGGFYRMRAEPGAPMTRFYYEETTWKARPSLSPDGAKLVYSSYLGRQWQQLWTIPPSGGYPFPLTYGEFDRTTPRWSPDGSRIAFISNETGDTSLWLFHWFGGKLEPVRIERLAYKQPMGTLRVRVLDQATGQPMAARVHLKAADARTYAPAESWLQVDRNMFDYMDTEPYRYFHTDGEFTVTLPVGRATLAVSKGFEWLPAETEVTVDVQKAAAVEVALKRLDNLQAKGWWNGNNHFHMNYAGAYRNTPEHLMLQGSAEGIHVLNNLICNKEQRIPDIAYFTGKPDPVSTDRQILYHNQEYHPPFWGHAVFLRLRRHLVIPDYVGYQETSVASLYPTNTTAFEIARAQGALAGYAHGAAPGPVSSRGAHFPVDLALGTVDFVEANSIEAMDPLYRAWNTGFRVVASAGEDAFPNFSRTHILGSNRVYVKTDQQSLDYDEWVEAFGAGRAFVTTGPLVFFTVNGLDPGDELRLPAGTHSLRVQADVQSITPIETIELLRNGQVVVTQKPAGRALKASVDTTVSADRSGWYAVRVRAQAARHPLRPGSGGAGIPFAATMPVWVIVDNQPVRSNIDAAYFMDWMDKTLERAMTGISVSNEPTPWNNEQEKEEVRQLYAQARALMQQRAQLAEAPSSRQQDQAIAQATIVEAQGAPAEVRPAPIHLALDEGVEVGSLQLYSQARAWMQQRAQLAEAPSSRQQDQAIAQATIVEARGAPAEVRPAPIHLALDEGVEVGSLQLYSQARAWMQQRAQLAEAPSSRQQDQAIAQATIVEAQGAPAEVRPAPIHLALDEGVEVGSLSMTIRFPSKLVTFQNVELGGRRRRHGRRGAGGA